MKEIESKEELNLINEVENDIFEVMNADEKSEITQLLQQTAKNSTQTLSKRKSVTLRLFERDIEKIKALAMNEGLPYQTYIAHIIHKVTTGQIKAT